jgi:hypothetical protein
MLDSKSSDAVLRAIQMSKADRLTIGLRWIFDPLAALAGLALSA